MTAGVATIGSIYHGYIWHDSAQSTTITVIKLRSDLHSRTIPNTSPLRATYEVSFVSYTNKKKNHNISRAHCTVIFTLSGVQASPFSDSIIRKLYFCFVLVRNPLSFACHFVCIWDIIIISMAFYHVVFISYHFTQSIFKTSISSCFGIGEPQPRIFHAVIICGYIHRASCPSWSMAANCTQL